MGYLSDSYTLIYATHQSLFVYLEITHTKKEIRKGNDPLSTNGLKAIIERFQGAGSVKAQLG